MGKAIIPFFLISASFLGFAVNGKAGQVGTANWKWDFEGNAMEQSPAGFSFGRTGSGRLGRWQVKSEKDAPSGVNVLAQTDIDATSYRFPVAVADAISVQNFRLSVRCKPVSGKIDQACGLVFRYRDENNYYVVRANALENNVRLYSVKDGKRQQFAGWDGPVAKAAWHGKIGLWTKADSLTYFDDLTVESLDLKCAARRSYAV